MSKFIGGGGSSRNNTVYPQINKRNIVNNANLATNFSYNSHKKHQFNSIMSRQKSALNGIDNSFDNVRTLIE